MKKFKELDKREAHLVEKDILKSWNGIEGILNETIKNRENNPTFVFYDGPIFLNTL